MANYQNAGPAVLSAAANRPTAAPIPAPKGFSPPVPTQSLLADMCKNAGTEAYGRLSVVATKPRSDPSRPVHSSAFSVAGMDGALPAEFDKTGHQSLSVASAERTPTAPRKKPPAAASIPPPQAAPAQKAEQADGILTPCAPEHSSAVFPQVEALSTVLAGQSLNFGAALFTENTVLSHEAGSDAFFISQAGVYELCYSLNYEVSGPCVLIVGFENFPQSEFKQQLEGPARGKLRGVVRLLLDAGTRLRLVLVREPALPIAQSALVSNAALEVRQLYRLTIRKPDYDTGAPEKSARFENSLLPAPRTDSRT